MFFDFRRSFMIKCAISFCAFFSIFSGIFLGSSVKAADDFIGLPPGGGSHTGPSDKKGMSWGGSNYFWEDYKELNVSWVYNWHYKPDKNDESSPLNDPENPFYSSGVEYVPMIWCSPTSPSVTGIPSSYSGYLLIINEPFVSGQCDKTVDQMVDIYETIRSHYPNAMLIGPAIHLDIDNFSDKFDKLEQWLDDITQSNTHLHGIAFHIYNNDSQSYKAQERDQDVVDQIRVKLSNWDSYCHNNKCETWITEFGYCSGTTDGGGYHDANTQFEDFVGSLEDEARIDRYSPFVSRTDPWRIMWRDGQDWDEDTDTYPRRGQCWASRFYDSNNNRNLFTNDYSTICIPCENKDNALLFDDSYTSMYPTNDLINSFEQERAEYCKREIIGDRLEHSFGTFVSTAQDHQIVPSYEKFKEREFASHPENEPDVWHPHLGLTEFGQIYRDASIITTTWDSDE